MKNVDLKLDLDLNLNLNIWIWILKRSNLILQKNKYGYNI